jgi:hypothetical protein
MTADELKSRIRTLAKQVYSKSKTDVLPGVVEYDELTKFPELKAVLVNLLTREYDNFLSSIDWVAPRPTTFRINLKNDQEFYLIYGTRSWIAQIEGKRYYLANLPEEERAAESLARILRYGAKEAASEDNDGFANFPEEKPAKPAKEKTPPTEPETPEA